MKDWAVNIGVFVVIAILADRTVSRLARMIGNRLDELDEKMDALQGKLEEIESKLDERSRPYINPIDL